MKKTILLLISVFFAISVIAQNNDQQIQYLKKQLKKSDEAIKDPKKSASYKTWDKRGRLYLEAAEINTKYLQPGIQAATIMFLGLSETNTEPYYGKPKERVKEGEYEVWKYDKVDIYIKNGVVDHFVDKQPIDKQALMKAYEAFKKAIELDQSGKYVNKKSTKENLAKLRNKLTDEAFNYLAENDYNTALKYIEAAIDLFQYPRPADDTTANLGAYYYYAGIIAFDAQQYNKAKMYLQKSIDENYEIGTCYQYIAQIYYNEGDSTKALKFLEEGVEKYPSEVKIVYSLIDYYSPRGMYDQAIKYLDKAIELTPDFAILYFVKSDAYTRIASDFIKKYFKTLKEADSCKKAAFKNRFNTEVSEKFKQCENEKRSQLDGLLNNFKKYEELAITWKDKGFEKDPNYDQIYLTFGYFYYDVAKGYDTYANSLPPTQTELIKQYNSQAEEYYQKSLNCFLKYSEKHPDDPDILKNISILYRRLHEYEKSREYQERYKAALEKQQAAQNQQQNSQ